MVKPDQSKNEKNGKTLLDAKLNLVSFEFKPMGMRYPVRIELTIQ